MKEYRIYPDRKEWCAVNQDFINIQESLCEFDKKPDNALRKLLDLEIITENDKQKREYRKFKCNNCHTIFTQRYLGTPNCITCKCGSAYVYEEEMECKHDYRGGSCCVKCGCND